MNSDQYRVIAEWREKQWHMNCPRVRLGERKVGYKQFIRNSEEAAVYHRCFDVEQRSIAAGSIWCSSSTLLSET
jgi:hypothetical protein